MAIKNKEEDNILSKGIIRPVDDLGRITIPKNIRDLKGIITGSPIEIFVDGDRIVLEKSEKRCSFCDRKSKLYEIKGKPICKKCIEDIKSDFL